MAANVSVKLGIDGADEYNKQIANITAKTKDLNAQLKAGATEFDKYGRAQATNRQKVETLTQKIELQKQKVSEAESMLAKVKEQYDEDSTAVHAFSEKVNLATAELNRMNQELQESGGTPFGATLKDVGGKMQQIGEVGEKIGKGLTTYVTAPLVGIGTMAVASFAEVDKTMALTNKTMGNTADEAELLNTAMKNAAANSTFGMKDAAGATLNFARAGLNAQEAAAALAPAMNLAAGEGGNLDTVSAGLVGTINGFGDSFDSTSHYADVFAAACNNSALDVDGLSGAMSVAAPIFSAAGYKVEDAATYMGVMANNGIDASVAANSLKTGFARLLSPAKDGAEMMEQLGISVTNADGSMKDSVTIQRELHDAFANLSEAEQIAAASAIFGKNQMSPWLALINTAPDEVNSLSESIQGASMTMDSFTEQVTAAGGDVDGMKDRLSTLGITAEDFESALNTCGGSAETFAEMLLESTEDGTTYDDVINAIGMDLGDLQGAMDKTSGTTDEMAQAMMGGFGGSIEQLKSSIDVLITSLGEALAPTIQKVVGFVQGLTNKFNKLTPAQQKVIAKIGMFAAAAGPVILVISKIIGGIGGLLMNFSKITGAVSAVAGAFPAIGTAVSGVISVLTGPIGIIVAAIAGITAAVVALWKTNEDFRDGVMNIWNGIKDFLSGVWETITGIFSGEIKLGDIATDAWEGLKTKAGEIWGSIVGFFQSIITVPPIVSDAWNAITEVAGGLFDTAKGVFTGEVSVSEVATAAWDTLSGTAGTIWEGAKAVFSDTFPEAAAVVATAWSSLQGTAGAIWDAAKGLFGETAPAAAAIVTDAWGTLSETAGGIWESAKAVFSDTFPTAAGVVATAWSSLHDTAGGIWEDAKGLFAATAPAAAAVATSAWDALEGAATDAWNLAKAVFTGEVSVKDVVTDAWSTLESTASTAWEAAKAVFETVAPAVKTVVATAWSSLPDTAGAIWDAGKAVFETVGPAAAAVVTDAWGALSSTASDIWTAAKNLFADTAPAAAAVVTEAWDTLSSTASDIWTAAKGKFEEVAPKAAAVVTDAWNTLETTAGDIWTAVGDVFSSFDITWPDFGELASSAFQGLKDAASSAWDWIKSLFGGGGDDGEQLKTGDVDISSVTGATEEMVNTVAGANLVISTVDTTALIAANSYVLTSVTQWETWVSEADLKIPTVNTDTVKSAMAAVEAGVKAMGTSFSNFKPKINTVNTDTVKMAMTAVSTACSNMLKSFSDMKPKIPTVNTDTVKFAMNIAEAGCKAILKSFSDMKPVIPKVNETSVDTAEKNTSTAAKNMANAINTMKLKIPDVGTSALNSAYSTVRSKVSEIKSLMNFSWRLPRVSVPAMPHISPSFYASSSPDGKVTAYGVNYRTSWYDKGGVFYDPAIIGVAERRPEFVGALDDLKDVVRSAMSEGGGRTFVQNNYSPKALSRLEIYRQTKNFVNFAMG